jgi:DNA repair protein RecO (recombination protein O)
MYRFEPGVSPIFSHNLKSGTLKIPRVPARVSDALVLRTYPLREADLIVSFFTRDQGKLRGVAKRARRPKSSFGSGLERLSHGRMYYFQRETRELVNLDSCELIHSQFTLASDYAAGVALDFIAEVSEQLLPPAEPGERFFRLLLAVLDLLRARQSQGVWPGVSYFLLWAVKLSGFLPELRVSGDSLEIAEEMLRTPVAQLAPRIWTRDTAADLRRLLVRGIEEHIERRLVTLPLLESAMSGG